MLTPAKAHSLRGYAYITAATFSWSICANLGRAAFTGRLLFGKYLLPYADPVILSQSRMTFAFLVFLPALLLRREARRLKLPAADLLRMTSLGIFGVTASSYFYYLAIQRTNVATAIIIEYTAPVWVLLYMVARGLQRATLPRVAAVALAVAGIALVIGLFSSGSIRLDPLGVVAALLAALAFAYYNIGGHNILAHYDHWIVLLYMTFAGSLLWIVINPPWKIIAAHYSPGQWVFMMVFSMLSVVVSFSFYIAGLRYLDPTRAIIVSCLQPVFSIVIAAIALGESVHGLQGVGIVLVLAAIVVVQTPDRQSGEVVMVEPIE